MKAAASSSSPPSSASTSKAREWNNRHDFSSSTNNEGQNAIIILNTDCIGPLFRRFWNVAGVKICADGGANRLYDGLAAHERPLFVPQYIKGDLDSLRPEVAAYYAELGTEVVKDEDQNTNDLEKCLEIIKQGAGGRLTVGGKKTNVIVLGALGLRFDHAMANLHSLYRYEEIFHRLVLLGNESLAFLLPSGRHLIRPDCSIEGPVCGLIPLAQPCESIITKGLRWDLHQGSRLAFGEVVSSSNEFKHATSNKVTVTVENSEPVVWTTVIKPKWRKQQLVVDARQTVPHKSPGEGKIHSSP